MKKISGVVITYNEEEKIGRALESLRGVVDELLVVDSFSEDRTEEICRASSDRFIQREWSGFLDQKSFAVSEASHDWVLSLDADEELSSDLQDEILEWKRREGDGMVGYQIPRLTYFLGRWIQHTTWFPDWQLRLFLRTRGRWAGGRIHESFQVEGLCGRMSGVLYHYTYESISEYIQQLDRFSSLAALDYRDRGRQATLFRLTIYPVAVFLKNYLIKRGFLDGTPGFVVSVLAAVSTFFNYLKLYELEQKNLDER